MTPHKLWTFIGVVGAFAGIVDVARQHKTRKELREEQEEQEPMTEPELPLDADNPREAVS